MDIMDINFDTVSTTVSPYNTTRISPNLCMTYLHDLSRTIAKDTSSTSVYSALSKQVMVLDEQYKLVSEKLQIETDRRINAILSSVDNLVANLTNQELIMRITYNDSKSLQFKTIFVPVNDLRDSLIQVIKKFSISKIDVFGKILDAKPWVKELSDLFKLSYKE